VCFALRQRKTPRLRTRVRFPQENAAIFFRERRLVGFRDVWLNRPMPTAKKPDTKPATKRKVNPALLKPVQPDELLSKVVGSKPLPRGELTKKIWDYIKKHKLQDEKKRTQINGDETLKAIFGGKKSVTMFELTKHVSTHIIKS